MKRDEALAQIRTAIKNTVAMEERKEQDLTILSNGKTEIVLYPRDIIINDLENDIRLLCVRLARLDSVEMSKSRAGMSYLRFYIKSDVEDFITIRIA